MHKIVKEWEFEMSHKLYLTYESPCTNLHGHSYKVALMVKSVELDENGMVMDFTELNSVKEWVMENWDHATLIPADKITDAMGEYYGKLFAFPEHNVTAELMCKVLHEKACAMLGLSGNLVSVKINETTNNYAVYSE